MAYSATWDETTPAGSEARSLGDDRIRELKIQIRERLLVASDSDYDSYIPSGTKMLFYQDTAPTGWTIQSTLDDKLVYVTKGSAAGGQTGGGVHSSGSWTISGFSANVGDHTLTTAEIPSHTHPQVAQWIAGGGAAGAAYWEIEGHYELNTGATGGGGAHNHPMASHNGTWRPAAYCCIVCSRD